MSSMLCIEIHKFLVQFSQTSIYVILVVVMEFCTEVEEDEMEIANIVQVVMEDQNGRSQSPKIFQLDDSANSSKFVLKSTYYLRDDKSFGCNEEFQHSDGNGNEQGYTNHGYVKITPQ